MILDFSSNADYLVALLPEGLLALAAFGILLADVFQRGDRPEPSGAWTAYAAIAGTLIAAGADVNTKSEEGFTALDFAQSKGHAD